MQRYLLENHGIAQSESAAVQGLTRELGDWKVQALRFASAQSDEEIAALKARGEQTIANFDRYLETGRQTSLKERQLGQERNEEAKVPHVQEELGALDRIRSEAIAARAEWEKLASMDPSERKQTITAETALLTTLENKVAQSIQRYREISEQEAARENEVTLQTLKNSDVDLFIGSMVAIVSTLLVSWLMARALVRPLRNLAHVAKAVSEGDHRQRAEPSNVEEFNDVGVALNRMLDALQETTITRDELEVTVKERVRELDDFFRLSVDLLCIADFQGRFLRVNPAFERTLGYQSGELTNRPFLDFVVPEDHDKTLKEFHLLTETNTSTLDFENRYRRLDGSDLKLSWKYVAIKEEGRIYGTARDVTELRTTEDALRRSEENLAITLLSIADGVLSTDAEGRILRMNPVAESLTGWSLHEAANRPIEEVFQTIHETTRSPLAGVVPTALAEGTVVDLTTGIALISRDGTERSISSSASPIRDRTGNTIGAVLTFRDVTQERLAAEATERRRARTLRFQHALLRLRDFEGGDLTALYRLATEECSRALEVERASIWLFDEQHGSLVCQDLYLEGDDTHSSGLCLTAEKYPKYFEAISRLEPLVADDACTHPATSDFLETYLKPANIHSMLDVPIRAGAVLTGVICCEHIGSRRKWTTEEVKFAGNIANALLVAIERQERAQTEEKLRASEEYNRSIVSSTEDCLQVLSLDGKISFMGEPGQRLLQVEDFETIRNTDWLDFWKDEDPAPAKRALTEARAGRIGRFQGMCPTRRGIHRWWDVVVSPINDAQGVPCRLLAVSRDITHQRRNEDHVRKLNATLEDRIARRTAELAEKEERFRLTIEQIQDYAIVMLDAGGNITSWNAGAQRIHGHSDEKALGQHISYFYTAGGRELNLPRSLLLRAEEKGHAVDEGWRLRKDGSRFWAEVVISAIKDDAGELLGFAQVTHDLTQRRHADLALRQSEEQFRSAMENSAIGMALVGLDGRWLKVNPALTDILGYSEAELLELNFQKLTYPEDLDKDLALVKRLLSGEITRLQMEKRYYHKDGRLVWSLLNATLIREATGEPRYFISQIQDITERKRSEDAMVQALEHEKELVREAKAGEHAKSEFLAVMSHEVRSPMNGILGFAEMLAQNTSLPEESRDQAQTIVDSGASLLRILDDILDFSRLEAGRLRIETEKFSPRKVVEDIGGLLTPSAREKGLTLSFHVTANVPETCEGDAARIRQILLNLSGNAIKFTQKGSVSIGLRTDSTIHLGGKPALEFFVRDTGPGIPEDRVSKIFEPFEQADSSTSRRFGGTGLGLTISRRLAVLMGGTLTVQSQAGRGAEFFFRLPLKAAETDLTNHVPKPETTIIDTSFALANPLRVLVVEDDRVNLKLILTMIRKFGYQPVAARNGNESIEAFRRQPFDCVLMDLQMPGMDGIEATRQIREIEQNFGMPATFISALTANTVPKDQLRCFDAGMNDYLNKPIKHEQLARLLVKACAHKKQLLT